MGRGHCNTLPKVANCEFVGVADLRLEAAEEVAGHAELLRPTGDVRTLPCSLSESGGLDGFYIARLRKAE